MLPLGPQWPRPLPNGQFSASSSGSWIQSLCWGGCVERGAWHVSWKLQVFGREVGRGLSGRSYLIGGGGLDGLSLGHWASLVRGRPPFSLWSSFTAVASKAPSHRPSACSSSVRLVPSPTDKWSGLALFPACPSSGQGQRGSKRGKAEGGSKREADTETLAREGDRGSKLDRCSSPETSSPGEGATLRGVTEEPLGESLPLPQQSWWC